MNASGPAHNGHSGGAKPKSASDLKLRLASAVVLGPLVLAAAYQGGLIFVLVVLAAGLLFLLEWLTMTGTAKMSVVSTVGFSTVLAVGVLYTQGFPAAALLSVCAGAGLVLVLSGFDRAGRWAAEGTVYSALAVYALLASRATAEGAFFLFFLLIVVWATDIFAYFTGRSLGGPKLWRRVSPNKTWSGAIGGLIAAVVLSAALALVYGQGQIWKWVALAVFLSAVSQAGDLLESAIKRRFAVKDSGGLIPGHGGIMDRVDGLVAAAIAAVVIGLVAGGSIADPISGLGLG
ncbi:phosphatidate cytidylyltransferase [Roseibium aquae]|uniref:Phosphatidate cytidylyltransferase n=1 Tax=Roseibium aquae TaxID=1323746 RepID=A0A916X1Y3_9HYPH|nr:CDP-archaeol synthase [Roseibium aquae]GGB60380.1 phosphatidate cytidylyltransferase [Roseibium aquae]